MRRHVPISGSQKNSLAETYVELHCGGVEWGNSIRALHVTMSNAASVNNRRSNIQTDPKMDIPIIDAEEAVSQSESTSCSSHFTFVNSSHLFEEEIVLMNKEMREKERFIVSLKEEKEKLCVYILELKLLQGIFETFTLFKGWFHVFGFMFVFDFRVEEDPVWKGVGSEANSSIMKHQPLETSPRKFVRYLWWSRNW